jgi:hypothetical protein
VEIAQKNPNCPHFSIVRKEIGGTEKLYAVIEGGEGRIEGWFCEECGQRFVPAYLLGKQPEVKLSSN